MIEGGADALERTADAVFASMSLAPLFPDSKIGDGFFEDGGVIENIPFRFCAPIEDCDLIFLLPLNATFQYRDAASQTLLKRVLRGADIRQGVLGPARRKPPILSIVSLSYRAARVRCQRDGQRGTVRGRGGAGA